jgi:hypothetical protein
VTIRYCNAQLGSFWGNAKGREAYKILDADGNEIGVRAMALPFSYYDSTDYSFMGGCWATNSSFKL